jgi:hypothetical protein
VVRSVEAEQHNRIVFIGTLTLQVRYIVNVIYIHFCTDFTSHITHITHIHHSHHSHHSSHHSITSSFTSSLPSLIPQAFEDDDPNLSHQTPLPPTRHPDTITSDIERYRKLSQSTELPANMVEWYRLLKENEMHIDCRQCDPVDVLKLVLFLCCMSVECVLNVC